MLRLLVVLLVLANLFFFAWARGWLSPVWPPPRHGEREPERVLAQVTPERVRVLPANPTASTSAPPTATQAAPAVPSAAAAAAPSGLPGAATSPLNSANGQSANSPGANAPGTNAPGTSAPGATASTPDQCLEAGPFAPAEAAAAAAALVRAGVPATRFARVVSPGAAASWLVYAGRFADINARSSMLQDWRRMGLVVELMDAPPEWSPGLVLSRHPSRDTAEVALSGLPDRVAQVARVVPTPSAAQPSLLRVAAADSALATRLLALPAPLKGSFRPCAGVR